MKIPLLLAALLAGTPALAHEGDHAKHAAPPAKGEHADAPRSFEKQPPEGTWARCAVSGDVFKVSKDTDFATYQGRVYAFCCPDCKPDFVKNPAKFADKKSS
jgi:YHS domain-containing protein